MSYSIKIDKTVYRSLAGIPKADRVKIIYAIDELSENPEVIVQPYN